MRPIVIAIVVLWPSAAVGAPPDEPERKSSGVAVGLALGGAAVSGATVGAGLVLGGTF